jgi:hypothetical protein
MHTRCPTRTVTSGVCVLSLPLLALLLLTSCKNDIASGPEQNAEVTNGPETPRAVFGEQPALRQRNTPARGDVASSAPQPKPQARERSSVAMPPAGPHRSRIVERSAIDRGSASSNPRHESASARFLYYRPPGARVGDTGELGANAQKPERPTSTGTISGLIHRWADTLVSRDVNAHMRLYARTLECSGSGANISRDVLRLQKERLVAALSVPRRFEIHDVHVRQLADGSAVAEFRVEWAAGHDRGPAASAWYRLRLRRAGGQWVIHCEEQSVPISQRRSR